MMDTLGSTYGSWLPTAAFPLSDRPPPLEIIGSRHPLPPLRGLFEPQFQGLSLSGSTTTPLPRCFSTPWPGGTNERAWFLGTRHTAASRCSKRRIREIHGAKFLAAPFQSTPKVRLDSLPRMATFASKETRPGSLLGVPLRDACDPLIAAKPGKPFKPPFGREKP